MSTVPNKTNHNQIIAAYTNYESDHTGLYDFFLGCQVSSTETIAPETLKKLSVPEQKYLVFPVKGTMPEALIQKLIEIWSYFTPDKEYKRTYGTDLEVYDTQKPDEATILIAIE